MARICCGRRFGSDATTPLSGGDEPQTLTVEIIDLLKLTCTLFISRVSFIIMKVTDSALLGHTGTQYLTAVALSDLWTSSTGVFVQSRAVAMFCGQAYGAGNKPLVGIWLQVAYVVLLSICLFVWVAWLCTGVVLRAFGKSEELAGDANYFAAVLSLCLPTRILYSQLTTFFASQKIQRPSVVCSTAGMLLNLVFGLIFVMGFPISGWSGYGFKACPWVTTIVEYAQLAILLITFCQIKQLHTECWPGWSKSHVTKQRLREYLKQYVPQTLSGASDWWRVSAIGAIASSLGDVNVAVWNTGYRICWIALAFNGSLVSAMGINLSMALGQGNAAAARRTMFIGVSLCTGVTVVLSLVVICIPRYCGMIFSNDPVILDLFEESRFALAAFVGFMNLSVILEGIPNNVGRSNISFRLGVVGSWVGQVPGAYLCSRYWRDDLIGLYAGSALGYALLCVLLGAACYTLDFQQLANEARARSAPTPAVNHGASLQKISEREGDSQGRDEES